MNFSKVKNILIALLLFVNSFLLFNVGLRYFDRITLNSKLRDNIDFICQQKNIVCEESLDFTKNIPYTSYELKRDKCIEQTIAQRVIKNAKLVSENDGEVHFEGQDGYIKFYPSGKFHAEFAKRGLSENDLKKIKSTIEPSITEIIPDFNLETIETIQDKSNGNFITKIIQKNNDYDVFNASITVILNTEDICVIDGTIFLISKEIPGKNTLSEISILDAFINAISSLEKNTTIKNFTFGYYVSNSFSSKNVKVLMPVFRCITQSSTHYFAPDGKFVE